MPDAWTLRERPLDHSERDGRAVFRLDCNVRSMHLLHATNLAQVGPVWHGTADRVDRLVADNEIQVRTG